MNATLVLPRIRRMRLSPTLLGYIARQFTLWFFSFLGTLTGIILLVSTVDLLDRLAGKDGSLGLVFRMVLLKLPYLAMEVMPFTILFAAIAVFWRLTRSNELVVTRAAGVSVWQFLLPVAGVAMAIAVISVLAINPVASAMLGRFEQLESTQLHNQANTLAVSKSGLWLRQADSEGQSVIHAQRVLSDSVELSNVIVFRFQDQDRFVSRIDAARAELKSGYWLFYEAWLSSPGTQPYFVDQIQLSTDLTRDKIHNSFAPPETISFWSLPAFIHLLENAGFSALRHKLQLHRLLALPLLFVAMVVLAATFSLRPQRRGGILLLVVAAVVSGFLLYFLSSFVFALGISGKIPIALAAWAPAGVSMLLGLAMLLHLEDG